MRSRKKRALTKAELRALGATPGLMVHRIGTDGRARLEQLTSEGSRRPEVFVWRLASNSKSSEGSETA